MCSKHKKTGLSAGLFARAGHLLRACAVAGGGGERSCGGLEREHSYGRRGCLERCCRVNIDCPSKLQVGLWLLFGAPVFWCCSITKGLWPSGNDPLQDLSLRRYRLGFQRCQPLLSPLFLSLSCGVTCSFMTVSQVIEESLISHKWQPHISADILWV